MPFDRQIIKITMCLWDRDFHITFFTERRELIRIRENKRLISYILMVLLALFTLFTKGCGCGNSKEEEYEMIVMKRFINDEGRRRINRPLVYGVKDIRFKGRSLPSSLLNKYNEDGERAL